MCFLVLKHLHQLLYYVGKSTLFNALTNSSKAQGDSDITYNINFNLFQKFIDQFKNLDTVVTTQKKFLTSMGILQRAEIISKDIAFSKKTDLFYRIRRLIDEKQMGELFKVMLVKSKNNKFQTGFQSD